MVPGLDQSFQKEERARTSLALARGGDALADGLAARVRRLTDAVNAFRWPDSGSSALTARLTSTDSGLHEAVSAIFPQQATPYFRQYSRGFDKNANASDALSLDPGSYEFSLALGGETEDLALDLDPDWSMDELLNAVAERINDSSLPVQAELIEQNSPHQRATGQVATGLSLGLGVNPSYGSKDPVLRDTSGHLVAALKLRDNVAGSGQATLQSHSLEIQSAYSPTSFVSRSMDPGAAPSLKGIGAGSYTFSYDYGPDSGSFSLDVNADDTWEDVLTRFANAAESAQDGFRVERTKQERLSDLLPAGQWGDLTMTGVALEITATAPKLGQRLSLSGADQASSAFLSTLGLNATAVPGADATLRIDGQTRTRAPGVFSLDQGRLLLEQNDSAESGTLTVREAYEEISERIGEISVAYNDLRSFLLPNQGYFEDGLAQKWRAPLQVSPAALAETGLREWGKDQLLWFDHDAFFAALGAKPERVRSLLLDADQGLFTQWAERGAQTLARPATEALARTSSLPEPFRPDLAPRTETDLERRNRLLDLLDAGMPDFTTNSGSGLLDRKG